MIMILCARRVASQQNAHFPPPPPCVASYLVSINLFRYLLKCARASYRVRCIFFFVKPVVSFCCWHKHLLERIYLIELAS